MAALAEYVALETKAGKLRATLAEVEGNQQRTLAVLAAIGGFELASELAGVSQAKVRDAVAVSRRRPTGHPAAEPVTEVAS